jgi:hypothetical protein
MIPARPTGAPLAKEVRKLVTPVLGDWSKTLQLALLLIVLFGCLTLWTLVLVGHLDPTEPLRWLRAARTLVAAT